MSIQNKAFSTDFKAWNHPRRVKLMLPVFAIIGYSTGYFAIPHVVESRLVEGIGIALFGGFVILLGTLLLALLD